MEYNPLTKLLLVCDAAEAFVALSKRLDSSDDSRMLVSIFECLISAENILDKGRVVVASEPRPDDYGGKFKEVVRRMDALRKDIGELMDRLDEETVASVARARRYQAESEWTKQKNA